MHRVTIEEFSGIDFGDKRRDNRFIDILNNISNQPGSSIPKQNKDWYDPKRLTSSTKMNK